MRWIAPTRILAPAIFPFIVSCGQPPLSSISRAGTWTGSGTCLLTTFHIDDETTSEDQFEEDFEIAVDRDGFPPHGSPFRTVEWLGLSWTAILTTSEVDLGGGLVGETMYVGDIEAPTARGGLHRLLRYDSTDTMSYREEWGAQLIDPETLAALEHTLVCRATLTRQ